MDLAYTDETLEETYGQDFIQYKKQCAENHRRICLELSEKLSVPYDLLYEQLVKKGPCHPESDKEIWDKILNETR